MKGEQDLIEAIKQNLVDSGCSKKQIEDFLYYMKKRIKNKY